MILPRIAPAWQHSLAESVSDRAALLRAVDLPCPDDPQADAAALAFRPLIPPVFLKQIRAGDSADPLLRQVLPTAEETRSTPGYSTDPLHEADASPAPAVLKKYAGRVLLMLTGACAIHCRYCFRRHYPYSGNLLAGEAREAALSYLWRDDSIREVILSGGDPLLISDESLARLLNDLEAIPHLTRLRIHSRLPVALPERISDELTACFERSRFRTTLVIHCNHPAELSPEAIQSLAKLVRAGVTLLNQSVLLRGVNDDVETLCALSEALFDAGVLPYYLHQLDPVQGADHFAVAEEESIRLTNEVRERLPGYLTPRLVKEIAGEPCKTPLS